MDDTEFLSLTQDLSTPDVRRLLTILSSIATPNLVPRLNNPIEISYYINNLYSSNLNLFPELSLTTTLNRVSIDAIEEKNSRVVTKVLAKNTGSFERYHDRSYWLVSLMCLEEDDEDKPFMFIRNTSQIGDNYSNTIIFNRPLYRKAVHYLFTLMQPDDPGTDELYEPLTGTVIKHPSFIPSTLKSNNYICNAIRNVLLYNDATAKVY